MEQCSYKDRAKRPTSDPVPLVQKAFTSLDKFLLPHPRWEQNGVGGGGGSSSIRDIRSLNSEPQKRINELPKIKSNSKLSP